MFSPKNQIPVDHLSLVLHEDGDVHKHLVQLLDRLLQLDEHLMPDRFEIIEIHEEEGELVAPLLDVVDGGS